jgi:hypothetical protein
MDRNFFHPARFLGIALACLFFGTRLSAQTWEDLNQQLGAFSSDHSAQFQRKNLNVNTLRLGGLRPDDAAQWNQFELVEKTKKPNKLGNAVKFSVTLTALHYENTDDRDWAVKNWLKQFMGTAAVRPGRNTKSVPDAPPGVIIIGERSIVLLTLPCAQYDAQTYREWRTKMAQYFATETSIILELDGCEGPLNWTKNAPDPTDRRWK